MSRTVSAIIPAHNEAARIPSVLKAVVGHPDLSEIIVVDDGSRDATSEVVRGYPVTLITLPKNEGKSRALARGIETAKGELLLFLDADLSGLTTEDVSALLAPVIRGEATVSMSLRFNGRGFWRAIGINAILRRVRIDYLTGERVIPRAMLLPHLEEIKRLSGFSIEVYLNSLFIREKPRIAIVPWSHVTNPGKGSKHGALKGLKSNVKMLLHIRSHSGTFGSMSQMRELAKLAYLAEPPKTHS